MLRRNVPLRRIKAKSTGFSRATVARIIDRDQRCVVQMRCKGEVDPRKLTGGHIESRGMGGSTDPQSNAVTNGIANCWPCNGWLEEFPLVAYKYGWKRKHGSPPGPILYPDGHWYVLTVDGQRRRTEEDAA